MSTSPSRTIETLYREHSDWLAQWLRRRLGCSQQALDLAQDTFVRLLARDNTRLETVHEPRAYLTTVARGLLIDHVRRRELEHAYLEALALQPQAYAPSPEQRQLLLETLLEVDRMLDGLSVKARAAWLYSRLDGMSHDDIAKQLGVSASRVRQYLAETAKRCYRIRFGQAD